MSGQRRGRPRALRAAVLATLALDLVAAAALAQQPSREGSSPSVALVWAGSGPELTCLGEQGLTDAVSEYLGRPAFASDTVDLILRVSVERLPDRTWRARLESQDLSGTVQGTRELTSSTELCSSLNEPLVLAVALMVDSEPEPPPPLAHRREPEAELEQSPPRPPAPSRAAVAHRVLNLDASLAAAAGLLPAVRPGLELGVELRASSWLSARVSAAGFLPATASLPGGAAVRFALLYGAVALCPGVSPSLGLRLSLCGGALYGGVFAQGEGFDADRSAQRRLLAGTFGARGSARLSGRWSGVAQIQGVIAYHPDRFVYELNGVRREVFRPSELSLVAAVGVSVMF